MIENSLNIYSTLSLEKGSYWFSKSNSFTLFYQFSGIDKNEYDIDMISTKLNELDTLSKKYFAEIEVDEMSTEAIKYFEYAKEAVNAKGTRIYRGKYVRKVIDGCKTSS